MEKANLPSIKALLIEDDPEDIEQLREILGRAPDVRIQIECADKLSTGIKRAAQGGLDVILLDLSLPDSCGLESVLRAQQMFQMVPFLVLTGISDEALGVRAVQEGAQDYLVKGQFDGPSLLRSIRYAIERKRLFDESAAMRQREALQKEFVANVSHELRTPLTVIKGFVESLRRGAMEDPRLRLDFLGSIERQVGRLGGLVEALLAMASLETEKPQVRPAALDLRAHVRDCIETFSARASELKVSLVCDGLERLEIWADPVHLSQALQNLLENALKYNRPGGSVRISGRALDDEVEVVVRDTGIGIPKEELPLIFTPFHRTPSAVSGGIAGTGLGLSIAKKGIELNGGRLWAESEADKGTAFHFVLPRPKRRAGPLSKAAA